MHEDLKHFRAHQEPDIFQVMTPEDALGFLVCVLVLAMILDVCGLLK